MSEVIQHKHEQKESKSCNIDIKIKLKIKETTKCKAKMLITGLSIPLHPILRPHPRPASRKYSVPMKPFKAETVRSEETVTLGHVVQMEPGVNGDKAHTGARGAPKGAIPKYIHRGT